jgi:hypothetical protein
MHGTICDGGASKISLFSALGIPLNLATLEDYYLVQNPACSRSGTQKWPRRDVGKATRERLQFRIICEMTTAWPVHNINGNKDTMA